MTYTIEAKNDLRGGESYALYKWDTYPRGSVLEGQARKAFVQWYPSAEAALADYPSASVGYRSAHNTYGHLPSEADPVPGGMYPDDYDDDY